MKSTLLSWRESLARLEALRQLHASIAELYDYPVQSREEMLSSLQKVILEEEAAAGELELKLNFEMILKADDEEIPSDLARLFPNT
jgi:hypothetical protein